jgi:hypothetical protein
MKKLYKVTMGRKSDEDCAAASSGNWYVIANGIPEAMRRAEHQDGDGNHEKAISVELVATEAIGLLL